MLAGIDGFPCIQHLDSSDMSRLVTDAPRILAMEPVDQRMTIALPCTLTGSFSHPGLACLTPRGHRGIKCRSGGQT